MYLGITITKQSSNSQSWKTITQKIKNKLHTWGSHWLNLPGKLNLIKSVLSSYPIFLFSIILAPKSILNEISKELRNFLWQGGKTTGKKFNLVNWSKVLEDKIIGGLGIRDPGMVNHVMGSKLVWWFIYGRKEWWKEVLWKKYLKKPRIWSLDIEWKGSGSSVWNLCKKYVGLIKDNVY